MKRGKRRHKGHEAARDIYGFKKADAGIGRDEIPREGTGCHGVGTWL